ncbi:MAG: hypothetical protein CMJ39_08770 [Phycisphaerae bacterium]|nr:hypothetical protein [Phycisphaerae bacterium]
MTEVCPRLISFYLPQFHPIPENDAWWGKGFTEWRNVTRGRPMFEGHDQPRRPADLGYYDLRIEEVQQHQADLAMQYGIHGFCYYHYWFAGTRLLERPLDAVLASGTPTLPFCVCWANENWTRRWDGMESEILIGQQHSPESDRAFITDLLTTLADDRYITVNGKKLLLVYRPTLLHNTRRATDTWRDEVLKAGLGELHLAMVQHGDHDPVAMGFDAAVEFPPHGFQAPDIRNRLEAVDPEFRGGIYDYGALVDFAIERPRPSFPLHRGVMLAWDNTARRGTNSTVYHGATPADYRRWLEAMMQDATDQGGSDEVVFINAWNEWAEGTYLEPDERHGHAWLEATREALQAVGGTIETEADKPLAIRRTVAMDSDPGPADVRRLARQRRRSRTRHRLRTLRVRAGNFMKRPDKIKKIRTRGGAAISRGLQKFRLKKSSTQASLEPVWHGNAGTGHPVLFIGHDAHLAGSQMLLLEMIRKARASGTMDPMVILLGDGVLESDYRRLAPTCSVVPMLKAGMTLADAVSSAIAAAPRRPLVGICSTIACADAAQACRSSDIPVVHLVNELPTTVEANDWEDLVLDIGATARRIIFVSHFSRKAFVDRFGLAESRCAIVHPGWLSHEGDPADKLKVRSRIRRTLKLPEDALIVLGCGQIHPRKGVDLFVQVAARTLEQPGTDKVHFVWIGDGTADHTRWVNHDVDLLPCRDQIHLIPSKSDIHPYFEAADLYVLSSREDPYPIVCVQAMASGLPVLAFDGAGGAPEALVDGCGIVVPFLDTKAMSEKLVGLVQDETARLAMGEAARARAQSSCSSDHHFEGVMDVVASTCGVDLKNPE